MSNPRCDTGCRRPSTTVCVSPTTALTLHLCHVHTHTHELPLTADGWTLLPEATAPEITTTEPAA